MTNFTIPNERKNVKDNNFKKELEKRKATNEQDYCEKYRALKYNVIWTGIWLGIPIALLFFIFGSIIPKIYILKGYGMWYIQAVITLYIGSLISKD